MTSRDGGDLPDHSRRRALGVIGGLSLPLLTGVMQYRSAQRYPDGDGDGIPDELKRSSEFHRFLRDRFGDQFAGLQLGRRELLLDVRYVGDVSVPDATKRFLQRRFRTRGIHLHWLDHPNRYDYDWFDREYGNNARKILWGHNSFYRQEIDEQLKNTSLQLIVVPGLDSGRYRGRIYSPWADFTNGKRGGYINGMNFGNRAVAAERLDPWEQTRLIFHEIAHLALCHDGDPENTGVMGTNETLTLTSGEWQTLRNNLDNVHDTTGFDVLTRRCLWSGDPRRSRGSDLTYDCRVCDTAEISRD